MTSSTIPHSSYPPAVAELLPRARAWVAKLGEVPSQNRIKAEFRLGTDKARQLRGALLTPEAPAPADPVPVDPPPAAEIAAPVVSPLPTPVVEPVTTAAPEVTAPPTADPAPVAAPVSWWRHAAQSLPLVLLALPAFVAIWSGWVGLGSLTGFGMVHPLPGIADKVSLNTAITLPIGVETYAAYALNVALTKGMPARARRFAKWSAFGSLLLGALGQVAYHLMTTAHMTHAPWEITTAVASLPVIVLGMGAALRHLKNDAD
ncbi:ABC transporter permease [Rugosimonospora africana]|uniref:ABC transporter permease n=1 Tax=Rugosimonospora africana TaxID=556532 RepID=A0A8J3R549_9ACTN|nr:ABC transporter permease [Rugosimonospora africana]GIH21485.1 ABC transporter permease [Rugosimonospora africana]